MTLHFSTFEYLKPSDAQLTLMAELRHEFSEFVTRIDAHLPEGPDKDHVIRRLREAAMWANVCVTRYEDGKPRE